MRTIRQIARRRGGLAIASVGAVMLLGVAVAGVVWWPDPLAKIAIGGVAIMFVAGDVIYLGQEWVDEWRYQRLVDTYEEARRTGTPVVLHGTIHDEWADWPLPHDMEERADMGAGDVIYERGDGSEAVGDIDVTDTQTGQGIQ